MNLPLAELLRPKKFCEISGQDHLLKKDGFLTKVIESQNPLSILLYGPPGCGKTTIAKIYAKSFEGKHVFFTGINHKTQDFKALIEEQKKLPLFKKKLIFFIDEIHRLNKAQQDVFLPYIENGSLIFIGATTENPSFSLNSALLSRLRVLTLNPLTFNELELILLRYEKQYGSLNLNENLKNKIFQLAQGDARYFLNLLENLFPYKNEKITEDILKKALLKKSALYDKNGDFHYQLISALHKSIRGSDPDASIYWLKRMLLAGEDPLYIIRRCIRIASEDIGLADPQALSLALSTHQAYSVLGSPEGELAIVELVIYLALCPKSNSVYLAETKASKSADVTSNYSPPKSIINAPTKWMKDMGYSKGYIYDHDTNEKFSAQNYFPENMQREEYYDPNDIGFEREMKKRKAFFKKLRDQKDTH